MKFARLFPLFALIMLSFKTTTRPLKVLFFGDSITEAAVHPGGYIDQIRSMMALEGRADSLELIGKGIGGNKVYDLYLRMPEDVLAQNPDVVFIYVGINDVWHKRLAGTGTDADKFAKFYEAMIRQLQARNIRVILCTPSVIGERTDFSNPLDGELNQYASIIRGIAKRYNCGLCDLRRAFLEYNLKNNPENKDSGILTTDAVHLNEAGNRLVAQEMLAVLR